MPKIDENFEVGEPQTLYWVKYKRAGGLLIYSNGDKMKKTAKAEPTDMGLKEYQALALKTKNKDLDIKDQLLMGAMGLGEIGELQNLIKKAVFHGHTLDLADVMDELGDVLWYVADICSTLGIHLEGVAQMNILKLKSRYPEGFSEEASKNRKE